MFVGVGVGVTVTVGIGVGVGVGVFLGRGPCEPSGYVHEIMAMIDNIKNSKANFFNISHRI